MNYKLNADQVRQGLQDFIRPESLLLWEQGMDVHVCLHTDVVTGEDIFLVGFNSKYKLYDNPLVTVNSITLDLYRPAPHVKSQLSEFAITVRNQLRLML